VHRPTLGIVATLLVAGGLVGTFSDAYGEDSLLRGGVMLRSGAVLGVLWLVLPKARALPQPVAVGVGLFAAVLIFRPRLVLVGIAVAFIAMVVMSIAQLRARSRE